jgi:hypothetical protein
LYQIFVAIPEAMARLSHAIGQQQTKQGNNKKQKYSSIDKTHRKGYQQRRTKTKCSPLTRLYI